MLKYEQFFENKMWYKTIPQLLSWLDSKSNMTWIVMDTETTGLGGAKKQQLTQVASVATNYDLSNNRFKELGEFDEKIKLTTTTRDRIKRGEDVQRILKFNHYGSGEYKYKDEQEIVTKWFTWIQEFSDKPMIIAQNAAFDMAMLGGRGVYNIVDEVFDTKILIQLYYIPILQKLAETNPQYQTILDKIGTSGRDNGLISSSMSKIGPALGLDMTMYHDALTDCRITMEMFTSIIDFIKQNKNLNIMKYQTERIQTYRA